MLSRALFALGAVALVAPPARAADPPSATATPAALEVRGLSAKAVADLAQAKLTPDGWAKVARLSVDADGAPALGGTWSAADGALRFVPDFPLLPGVKYRVALVVGGERFQLAAQVPKPPPGPRARVLSVYPSASVLPENALRVYVHFSAPVKRGDVYSRVKLVRDDGKAVNRPFLELDEELWSADGLRLTYLFDPGRVKRGLVPREELGPILEAGRRYTLEIDASWPDGDGRPLLEGFQKRFAATAPDDEPVWPNQWKLTPPRAGSDAPLLVRLAKPLDRALLNRMLWVVDATGARVPGTISVGGGERVVSFVPANPWARGDYKLVIDDTLEDVCGNRVGEPFEVDVFKPIPLRPMAKLTERPFAAK
jgi:hypothetical protein